MTVRSGASLLVLLLCACASRGWRYEQTLRDSTQSTLFGRLLGNACAERDGSVALVTASRDGVVVLRSGASYHDWRPHTYRVPGAAGANASVQCARYNGDLLVFSTADINSETRVFAQRARAGADAQQLVACEGTTKSFSGAVALAPSTARCAAVLTDEQGGGAVAVFENSTNNTLACVQVLEPDSKDNEHAFGASVAMADDVLVVGAPARSTAGSDASGLVYTFDRGNTSGWATKPTIISVESLLPAGKKLPLFGHALSLTSDGLRLAVSAPCSADGDDVCEPTVFVFGRSRGDEDWTLLYNMSVAGSDAAFGASVVADTGGGALFVSVSEPGNKTTTGAVHVFRDGEHYARITAARGADWAVGTSIAMYGDILAVGTHSSGNASSSGGSITMFSVSQLSEFMMAVLMSCSLVFFLVVVLAVLAVYKLQPSTLAAARRRR